jgi:general secretion pathway protein A
MYQDHFGLSARPFQLNPDARYYFNSKHHSRALAHLTYGLAQGDGFVVVTGEIGAGKTTLLEHLVSNLDPSLYVVGKIATTQLAPTGFLRTVLAAFEIAKPANDKAKMLQQFREFHKKNAKDNRRAILVVDEVQNLPLGSLEELRMLSNLTAEMGTPWQTFLVGQPQFRKTLASHEAEQLRQRVVTTYHLDALLETEVGNYVCHRLSLVGWSGKPKFENDVFHAIYYHSAGIPRRINLICDRLLLEAYLDDTTDITADVADQVIRELREEETPSPQKNREEGSTFHVMLNGTAPIASLDIEQRVAILEKEIEQQSDVIKTTLEAVRHYCEKKVI